MSGPQRKPDQTAISVSMSRSLVAAMDKRAKALGLNRSQFIAQLARADLAAGGDLTLKEDSPKEAGEVAPKIAGSRELTKYPSLAKGTRRSKTGA